MSDASELALPIDWKLIEVEKFSQVKGGKRLPAGEEFADEMTPYPYLRVTNMVNGTIKDEGIVYVKPEIQKIISNYTVASQDLYVTIAGTLGLFGRIPEKYSGAQLTENAAKLTKIDLGDYDLDYLNYSLRGDFVQSQINKEIGIGAGVPKLALYRIEKLKVPLPSTLNKQQKIAKILTTIDQLIEKTQALIDKHTAIKQGMMADLFTRGIDPTTGQLRPPVEQAPHLYKETELGWVPKEWDVIKLSELFSIKHGHAFEGGHFSDRPPGEILLTPGNFHRTGGLYFTSSNTKYFTDTYSDEYVLGKGDYLVVMTDLSPQTLILGRFVFLDSEVTLLHNQRIGKLISKTKLDWDQCFLIDLLNQERLRKNIALTATGTTVRHTSPDRILDNFVVIPNHEEQIAIGKILEHNNSVIKIYINDKRKHEKVKNSLMQDLLTGTVAV